MNTTCALIAMTPLWVLLAVACTERWQRIASVSAIAISIVVEVITR